MKLHQPCLAAFDGPEALVSYLANPEVDAEEKNGLFAELVRLVRTPASEVAWALLWLGLWPGLDSVYQRRLKHFAGAADELASCLAAAFTALVKRVNLHTTHRVAATLVRSTERDVMDAWRRARCEDVQHARYQEVEEAVAAEAAVLPAALAEVGLSPRMQVESLVKWLRPLRGGDMKLVLSVLLLDEDQAEAGARQGLTPAVARKRFQRALLRIRKQVEAEGGPTPEEEKVPAGTRPKPR
ncbi:sigma-70 family RNA polymerase sigma factor [Myxococcus qinghaiensis]|uniref:sigma-70 family RNA polymerase sigma factor n=1 Tax=Myxococcus qinghaiensis TaxID=2906758 RepID=UPI0020A7E8F4|nr:sigma-70 family RNA polymerase sigma factor [Myxococcus qinghaiensis]MCP3170160.1 sigma-70 family RNA polymerase sigma factor [Myxococcus qinghaiensis]